MFYGWIEKFRQFTKTLSSIVLLQSKIVIVQIVKDGPLGSKDQLAMASWSLKHL